MKKVFCFYMVIFVMGMQTACAAVQIASPTTSIIPAIADGQVTGIQASTALMTIRQAVDGAFGTQIMAQGEKLLFIYTFENGWSFVALNMGNGVESALGKVSIFGGNIANVKTTQDLIIYLKEHGWEQVSETYPAVQAVKEVIGNGAGILGRMAGSMTTLGMVVVPSEEDLLKILGHEEVIQ